MLPAFLTLDDDGKSFDGKVGNRIEFRLPENGTTGYIWYVDQLPNGVALVNDIVREPGDALGASYERHLEFEITRPIEGELRLEERRDWESPPDVLKSLTVTIRATPANSP